MNKALDWIEETDSPRFVWVHLMEPHGPYYAGLSEAWNNGLLETYQTFYIQGTNTRQELIESDRYSEFRHQLQKLYNSTNRVLDNSVVRLLSACSSDTKIYLTADHGEEFSDEWYGHSRPYDDCIKVPFYTNVDPTHDNISRHVEIASEILAQEGIKPPKDWKRAAEYSDDCSFIIHPSIHGYGQLFVGCRTPNYHYLQLRNPTDGRIESEELYQDDAFTNSKKDISEAEEKKTIELRQKVDAFIEDFEIEIDMYTSIGRGAEGNVDESVSARLEELGYID
ncbi:sulfatase-like hydrolase/transferase [Halohasta litorea]|uniref:Sulfatase-like hydrolase/transferase n=1 Tax=Halohasta litorea TaxID=869891 RepID=A0ABD6D6K8_9EURY|nr:sulfatase-like hydrolase/transferase [Halohasta litorea]